jgi:hypothetical protein
MCMRITGHPSSSQPGAGSAQNASSGSPLDPTPAHNVADNHFDSSTTQQLSQKPTGEQPPGGRIMTWDELEELRDRLNTVLEYERAEDGFSPIEEDYYIQYRQAARRAVADIDPDYSRDRDRYRTLQEIYDAVEEIYDIRSAKLRMAVRDRVVFRRDVDRPENLTIDEVERYDMAISLGGHNVE